MLEGEGMRVGVVEREEMISWGRESRKALSMLMVRGTCLRGIRIGEEAEREEER